MSEYSSQFSDRPKSVILTEHLGYSYTAEAAPALQDVNLTIPRGQLAAMLGANGSGKSTLAKLLAGLLMPSAGALQVLGCDLANAQSAEVLRGRVGIVFQSPDQQMVATTIEREIAFGPENLGLPPVEIRARAQTMMKQFKLETLARRLPHQLSGGEKQRLALASVLAMKPEILILDEVTSLLDPCDRKEVLCDIENMKGKCTIIMITQFAEEALIADRVIMMQQGRLALDGAPADLFAPAISPELFGVEIPLVHRLLQAIHKKSIT